MTGADINPARRAALLIHGLSGAQRSSLLAQLEPQQRKRLQPLLDDLVRQGIPSSLGRPDKLGISPSVEPIQRVRRASGDDINWCLQSCSARTIAAVLRAEDWPWADDVMDCMAPDRREKVQRLMHSVPVPPPAVLRVWLNRIVALLETRSVTSRASSSGTTPVGGRLFHLLAGFARNRLERLMRWVS